MSLLAGKLRAQHQRPRWDRNWYVEPRWCAAQLFAAVPFKGPIHDPCCGEGRIVLEARAAGYRATGADIVDRGFPGVEIIDFLEDQRLRINLVFNPPGRQKGIGYLPDLFIRHALEVASGAIAMIVPVPYLCGQERYSFFIETPPQIVLFHSRRPSMPPGGTDIPAKNGTCDYAWVIWAKGWRWPPEARWLPP